MLLSTFIHRNFVLGFSSKIALGSLLLVLANTSLAQDGWVNGRTIDGQPDFQGIWTNETRTPMERLEAFGTKAYFNEEEIEALEAGINPIELVTNIKVPEQGGSVGAYGQEWLDMGGAVLSTGQTSLIMDPPNGRAPIRDTAWKARQYDLEHLEDSYVYHTVWDRCITRGVPGAMLPAAYNNAYNIVQTEDHFVIMHEMIHEVRVIPLKKSQHIDEKVKLWMGDSVAHWEGETLVVETKNFNDKTMIANSAGGGRLRGLASGDEQHLVERFTRISEDTIIWEVRITSPRSFTQPVTISMPLTRDPEYTIYEYACHEGNHALGNILRAGREREAREAAAQ